MILRTARPSRRPVPSPVRDAAAIASRGQPTRRVRWVRLILTSVLTSTLTGLSGLAIPSPAAAEEPTLATGLTLRPVTPLQGYMPSPGIDAAGILVQADELRASGLAASGYRYVLMPADVIAGRDEQGALRADPARFPEGPRATALALRARDLVPGVVIDAKALAESAASAAIAPTSPATPKPSASPTEVSPPPAPDSSPELPADRDADLTRLLRGADLGLLRIDLSEADGPVSSRFRALASAARRIRPTAVLVCNAAGFPGDWVIGAADAWCVMSPPAANTPSFQRITAALDASVDAWRITYPGATPDLGPLSFDGLDPVERQTHLAVWTMMASPLWITGDLTEMDNEDLGLLVNPALVALHQDPLVQPARRLAVNGDLELWARPLGDGIHSGHLAVMMVNRGADPGSAPIDGATLGLDPAVPVTATDLLTGQAVETGRDVTVAPHAAVLLRYEGTAVRESPFAR